MRINHDVKTRAPIKHPAQVLKELELNDPINLWAFLAQLQSGAVVYIDQDGFTTTIKHIKFFRGTSKQARAEARARGQKFGQLFSEKLKAVTYQKLDPAWLNNPDKIQKALDRLNFEIGKIQASRGSGPAPVNTHGQNRDTDPK